VPLVARSIWSSKIDSSFLARRCLAAHRTRTGSLETGSAPDCAAASARSLLVPALRSSSMADARTNNS